MVFMCCFLLSTSSLWNPRSRTQLAGLMISEPIFIVDNFPKFVHDPSQIISASLALSWSQWEAHQAETSSEQSAIAGDGYRQPHSPDLTHTIVIHKQMKLDTVSIKHVSHFSYVGDEYEWATYCPAVVVKATVIVILFFQYGGRPPSWIVTFNTPGHPCIVI